MGSAHFWSSAFLGSENQLQSPTGEGTVTLPQPGIGQGEIKGEELQPRGRNRWNSCREAAPADHQGGRSRWQQHGDISACDGRALAHTSASSALRGAGMMAEGWEIYNGISLWLCQNCCVGPLGGRRCPARAAAPGPSVLPCRCCPQGALQQRPLGL